MAEERVRTVWSKIGPNQGIDRVLPQVPKTRKSLARDASRTARLPGKRLSKNNKEYWETRENRSDRLKSNL